MTGETNTPKEITDDGLKALAKALRISFNILVLIMVASLAFFLWRSLFVVESNEVGILLRFGKVVSKDGTAVLAKGPHFAWPYPVDTQLRVPTGTQTLKVETFWHNNKNEEMLVPGKHGYTLTGDMNILHNQWTLKYRVIDPLSYALRFPDADSRDRLFKALLRNSVVSTAASLTVDTALYDRERLRQAVRSRLASTFAEIKAGIEIEQLIYDPAPPQKLQVAFESVTKSEERKSGEISKARGNVQKLLSDAAVRKEEIIAEANTAKAEKIAEASSDVEVFIKLYEQYKANPSLFKKLYYEQKLKKILSQVDETFIIDRGDNRSLYLEINPEPEKKADDGK